MADKHPAEVLADDRRASMLTGTLYTWSAAAEPMLRTIPALEAERDAFKVQCYEKMDANHALRNLGGALPDEDMGTFLRRVIAERNQLRAELDALKNPAA